MSDIKDQSVATLANGVKLVGETFLPGTSLLLDGNVKNGAAHVAVGLGARLFFGPLAWAVVAADSFSTSVSGKTLTQHASDLYHHTIDARAAKKAAQVEGSVSDAVVVEAKA